VTSSSADRLANLRQKLTEKPLDALLVSHNENRTYLSGMPSWDGYLLITAKEAVLATDSRFTEAAKMECPDYDVFQIVGKAESWFPNLLGKATARRLGFEADNLTFAFDHTLTEIIAKAGAGVELVPVEGMVQSLRMVKDPGEIALIARAAEITDQSLAHLMHRIHPGMTELEAAWEIEKFMREHDSEPVAFELIVAAGPNAALPHHRPSSRPIQAGEPVVIDIGARVGGYCADLTRTICLGRTDDQFRKVYDTVLAAQLAALAMIKEGMTGEAADSLARTVISEAGYGDKFGHSLGHGVGLEVHEAPLVSPRSTQVLSSGMVFTVEPGIYLPGWGGVRIEDLVTLEDGKLKILSKAPKVDA